MSDFVVNNNMNKNVSKPFCQSINGMVIFAYPNIEISGVCQRVSDNQGWTVYSQAKLQICIGQPHTEWITNTILSCKSIFEMGM